MASAQDFKVLVAGTGFTVGEGRKLTPFQRAIVLAPHGQPHPVAGAGDMDIAETVRRLNKYSWGYSEDTVFAVLSLPTSAFYPSEDRREPRSMYIANIDGFDLMLIGALTDHGSDWHVGAAAVSKCGRLAEFEESYNVVTRKVCSPSDAPVRQPGRTVGIHRVVRFSDRATNVVDAVRSIPGRYDFHESNPAVDHQHRPDEALLEDCHALINQTEMNAQQFLGAVSADSNVIHSAHLVCAFHPTTVDISRSPDDAMMRQLVKSLLKSGWTDEDRKRIELLHSGQFAAHRIPTMDPSGDVMAHADILYSRSALFRRALESAAAAASGSLNMGAGWPVPAPTKLAAQTCLVIIYIGALDAVSMATWIESAVDSDVRDLLRMCAALDEAEPDDESRRFVDAGKTAAKVYFWSDTARLNPERLYKLWDWLRENIGASTDDLDILHVLVEIYLYELHRERLDSDANHRLLVEWTGRGTKRKRARVDIDAVLRALSTRSV